MVEHMAVNHLVVGSIPTWGVFDKCERKLMVKFSAFQADHVGSSPTVRIYLTIAVSNKNIDF